MPELFRSLASRLRKYVGDRRRTDRHRARLEVSVSLIQKTRKADGAPPAAALAGHSRDVSSDGLSIVVPAIHIDGHHLVGEGRSLLIELEIAGTPVLLKVKPVRYERLEEDETDSGYLIGLHIDDIESEGLAAYHAYVEGLKE